MGGEVEGSMDCPSARGSQVEGSMVLLRLEVLSLCTQVRGVGYDPHVSDVLRIVV